MSKRNIAYIKPEDPKFLRLLKEQVGYKDTNPKFDKFDNNPEDFVDDDDSEKPQVVVLKPGDLTAEEAAAEEEKKEKAESEAKADLSQKIIFTAGKKQMDRKRSIDSTDKTVLKKSKKERTRPVLSFDYDEDNE